MHTIDNVYRHLKKRKHPVDNPDRDSDQACTKCPIYDIMQIVKASLIVFCFILIRVDENYILLYVGNSKRRQKYIIENNL